ncbi:3,4-dihydroxy-2-butanone-4-phosphate synthase [Arthrobacter livingstonensis]|uniref:3,4-dihydroxy-2-butanone 4-phosphate synthase n=1 Tax=Arthrobacter livingstonensis TaxID=670078 RepID=A0A2V5LK62_9MICC|nr:3,4-dihydroxy-2-butanone-4-phosphate synthase [Arthrobacter livingstonensis]PYI67620.1 3,4-dihydroxy-2-butanone-4-phosphate synthase [Arthrobacter livingstonensis]
MSALTNPDTLLDPVEAAITAIAAGQAVLVVDDENRENEGDIIFAAQHSTPALMGWTIRHSSGVICVPMDDARANALELPPMVVHNQDAKGTAYTVSCDAAQGVSTGISATDRSLTATILADPASRSDAVTRPGHMFPLRAVPGGVRQRPGHTEASVELCRLAGCEPVAIIAEVVDDVGQMVRLAGLREFADANALVLISIADLVAHLNATGRAGRPATGPGDVAAAAGAGHE